MSALVPSDYTVNITLDTTSALYILAIGVALLMFNKMV